MVQVEARVRLGCAMSAIVATTLLAWNPADADAVASTGVAYDTVLTLVTSAHPPLRRRDFGEHFQAGLTPDGACMPAVTRRYITSDRERIDSVCQQDATIVDCVSRTVTSLDLQHKLYARTSMDLAYDDGIAEMRALGDSVGSTSTIAIERSARGPRSIDGMETEEFENVRTQTFVAPDLSTTDRDSWTYDFSPDPLPSLNCIEPAAAWLSRYGYAQQYAPELQPYFSARFKKMLGPRDTITESGPGLPDWRIPLYGVGEHVQTQTNVPVETRYFEIESGNIRTLQSDDPVFRVPAGFTNMAR